MKDDIFTSIPIDKTAAIVVSKGFEYVPDVNYGPYCRDSKFPLPTTKPTKNAVDLTGLKSGRLIVVGLSVKTNNIKNKGKWVVRCTCGNYSLRSSRAIRNPKNINDCCRDCMHILYLKRADIFRRTGKLIDAREIE